MPSEKAFAYKMKLEAMKRRAGRPIKENGSQLGNNFYGIKSSDVLAEQSGESKNQIFRYIRLTNLIPDILEMVDEKTCSFNAGVEVSYLKTLEQQQLVEIIECNERVPSLSQARRLKNASMENRLTEEVIMEIMSEERPADTKLTIGGDKINKYFPREYTPKQMEKVILELLEQWNKKRLSEEMIEANISS